MMPYYFEVPEITLPFDVLKYLDNGKLMLGNDQIVDNNADYVDSLAQGKTSSKEAGWYLQGFGGGNPNQQNLPLLADGTGMTEEQNADMSKELNAWANDLLNIRMTSVSLLRSLPGKNGWWHCEGPSLRSRRCALNFLVEGKVGTTKAQWGYNKKWGNIAPEQVERMGYIKTADVDHIEVLDEYVSPVLNRGFFYNTMYLHRGVNEECSDTYRTICSIACAENIDINIIHKKYLNGTLFK
tara:strand:- start:4333 stop:5052 length:720 start_codon:yes stop_codon:yes gene_type:complete